MPFSKSSQSESQVPQSIMNMIEGSSTDIQNFVLMVYRLKEVSPHQIETEIGLSLLNIPFIKHKVNQLSRQAGLGEIIGAKLRSSSGDHSSGKVYVWKDNSQN